MKRIALCEHGENGFQAPLPRLWRSGGLKSPRDGVPVGLVQRLEERTCFLVFRQRLDKVLGKRGPARRIIRVLPPAVLLRDLDFLQTTALHSARFNEPHRVADVDPRPDAPLSPWRELSKKRIRVVLLHLPVDPAVT